MTSQGSRVLAALDASPVGVVPNTQQQTRYNYDRIIHDAAMLMRPLQADAFAQNLGGFQLNYSEGPILGIDSGGSDQETQMADFVNKSFEKLGNKITVKEAMAKLGLKNNRDILPGMEVRLLSHQIIGVSWMLDQERGKNKGGILADEMGLGKTVEMIATMSLNMPDPDPDRQTTLIVVPAALLQQWKEELETKTNAMFTTHVHYGRDKLKTAKEIERRDVIITSYQTLTNEFAFSEKGGPENVEEWKTENGGPLSKAAFYRVVLDEAQFIRNRSTRASIAVAQLNSRYRWMLTGTPVTNNLADIYGLLRFGRFRPWNDWIDFRNHVVKIQEEDAPLAGQRAQAILNPIMLRRAKNSEIEGEPILKLPPKQVDLVELEFSAQERELYDSFEKQTWKRLDKIIKDRALEKNHMLILVLLLRLRQICCHPNLVLSQADQFEDPTLLVGSDSDKERSRATKVMGAEWVALVIKRFLVRARAAQTFSFHDEDGIDETICPACYDFYSNGNARLLSCKHELCFDCMLNLKGSDIQHNGIFGEGSEADNNRAEREYETAAARGLRPCPTCKTMVDLSNEFTFLSDAFEPTPEELRAYVRSMKQTTVKVESSGRIIINKNTKPSKSTSGTDSHLSFREAVNVISDDEEDDPDVTQVEPDANGGKRGKRSYEELSDLDDDDELPDLADLFGPSSSPPRKKLKNRSADLEEESGRDTDTEVEWNEGERTLRDVTQASSSKSKGTPNPSSKDKGKEKENDNGLTKRPSEALVATWRNGGGDLEPSTKMIELVRLLQRWRATGDKIIVYSQWTSMLDLLETVLARNGIRGLRYDGRMDRQSRDQALSMFKTPKGPKVILISTKCGGIGLNLVVANRIVNMDLSWNYATEAQAYDRVHRLGQEKNVYVRRLVVKNTIEERMLQLQEVKTGLADAALGEGTGTNLHKLSVQAIKHLFGMTEAQKKKDAPRQNNDEFPAMERLFQ